MNETKIIIKTHYPTNSDEFKAVLCDCEELLKKHRILDTIRVKHDPPIPNLKDVIG